MKLLFKLVHLHGICPLLCRIGKHTALFSIQWCTNITAYKKLHITELLSYGLKGFFIPVIKSKQRIAIVRQHISHLVIQPDAQSL